MDLISYLRRIARRVPGASRAYASLKRFAEPQPTAENVFTDIFRGNRFGGTVSVSGRGSDLEQTRVLVRELPALFRDQRVTSVLDIPCGDFYWMRHVNLAGIDYVGADIVAQLVERNRSEHTRAGVRFERLDLINDRLPTVDLVLSRDCFVHLCFTDVARSLRNICASGSRLLLTTTFTARTDNIDIRTGEWRTLNLELPPFSLPPPIAILNEQCTEGDGAYGDKSLGLWRVADIAKALRM